MGDLQEPSVASTKPIRRFAVQPVEVTSSSNRSSKKNVSDNSDKQNVTTPRRFLPQPEETSTRSNRAGAGTTETQNTKPSKRFLPQPEETSTRSSRKSKVGATGEVDSAHEQKQSTSKRGPNGKRLFSPQLIETSTRSRKSGDELSSWKQTDKTDISPGDKTYQPRHVRMTRPPLSSLKAPDNTPLHSMNHVPQISESRFSYASLSARKPEKRKSFAIPTLDSITSAGEESDDSVESSPPSLSTTPSAASEIHEVQNKLRKIHTDSRDERDTRFSGQLLTLAAAAAKKQLQEQALAAFPNERDYQTANHFALDDEGSGDDDTTKISQNDPEFYQRRMSTTGWDVLEMQKHKEMLEEQRRQQRMMDEEPERKESEFDPWENPYDFSTFRIARVDTDPKKTLGGALREAGEVTKMRHAASPPMLGSDITFMKSLSPQHTMMDPTQKPVCRKSGKHNGLRSRRNSGGLWTPHGGSPVATRKNTTADRHHAEPVASPGLWGGFCQSTEHHINPFLKGKDKHQSGLMTPGYERSDPFSPAPTPTLTPWHQPPITPKVIPEQDNHLEGIDSILELESNIDEEYPDTFVTQVYNYLSLGYPALARDYDSELSKISRVPLDEIRRSDNRIDSKGHIGAPESEGWDERKCMEECGRWSALRLYIREWARQQPKFKEDTLAARARRGSWGN